MKAARRKQGGVFNLYKYLVGIAFPESILVYLLIIPAFLVEISGLHDWL